MVWDFADIVDLLRTAGAKAEITSDAVPGRRFGGTVVRWQSEADPAKGTQQAKVRIDDPDPLLVPETLVRVRYSLITIAAMLALGYVTRYSGSDATLGLALAKTGSFYPFFGTLLGWLGVALTGSDTASNVLFGSLQTITAKQAGLNPVLMAAANSSGGVMGKMVDAQSIVVASTATNWYGHEDKILRFVFFHSIALACLVGILVYLQAYVAPFTQMVVR